MQVEKKNPTHITRNSALGKILVIKKNKKKCCYNLLVGRAGEPCVIRLQSALFKTIKIYNLTVEMTQ